MWTFLGVLAFLGLVAAVVWFVYQQQPAKSAASSAPTSSSSAPKTGYRSGPQKFTERMSSLPINTMMDVMLPDGKALNVQVAGRITFYEKRQYQGPRSSWTRSGVTWEALYCVGSRIRLPYGLLLVNFGSDTYAFFSRTSLDSEGNKQFVPFARAYVANGDKRGVSPIDWKGVTYLINDIGKWDLLVNEGEAYAADGEEARFIQGATEDGKAILVEDSTGAQDFVWTGFSVDLDSAVTNVLTPTGE